MFLHIITRRASSVSGVLTRRQYFMRCLNDAYEAQASLNSHCVWTHSWSPTSDNLWHCTAMANLFCYFFKLEKAPLDKVLDLQFLQKQKQNKRTKKKRGKTKMLLCVTFKKQPRMIGMHGPVVPTVPTVPLSLSSASWRKKQTLFPNENHCLNQSCVLQQRCERNTRKSFQPWKNEEEGTNIHQHPGYQLWVLLNNPRWVSTKKILSLFSSKNKFCFFLHIFG